jgi:cytochrome oxidase assembly protein ShyY1
MTAAEFFRIARRPLWIGALVLSLAIAAAFAALGQWQLSRSVENAAIIENEADSEKPVPLGSIAEPQQPMTDPQLGRMVTVEAALVDGDFTVLTGRSNDGVSGAWLVAHGVTADGASLAVALGWAPDEDAARAAADSVAVENASRLGRYLASESPHNSEFEEGVRSALSVGELINLWAEAPDTVYAGYLVAAEAPGGLEPIDSPPPLRDVNVNLLNLFYAAEWVLFAGFAVYLWYRLVKDVWEKERAEEGAAASVD